MTEMETAEVPFDKWGAAIASQLDAIDKLVLEASEEDKLWGYAMALAYVTTQLRRYPGFDRGLLTLNDLLLRLLDMTAGKKALQPIKRPKGGRPAQSWRDHVIQGRAAAGMQILIDTGDDVPRACEMVAKALRAAGIKGRQGGPLSAATVRDWYDNISLEHATSKPDARDIYEHALSKYRTLVVPSSLTKNQTRALVKAIVAPPSSLLFDLLANPGLSA